MAIRSAFCLLAEGIETHRDLAQVQKEQIEKNKAFMEGMQHFKVSQLAYRQLYMKKLRSVRWTF